MTKSLLRTNKEIAEIYKRQMKTVYRVCFAYISCDPATLVRDVKHILSHGYQLESITPFDLFPHTAHVKTVVLIARVK